MAIYNIPGGINVQSVCVYCGSSPGSMPFYLETARAVGRYFASQNIRLVYGGGKRGLMGAVANACMEAGGEVFGVMPEPLVKAEFAHKGITELVIVDNMHQRKESMIQNADGFIALPGGIGTAEELFEVFTWHQLGLIDKPCGILNVEGYYDHLLNFLKHTVDQGFLKAPHIDILQVSSNIEDLIGKMTTYERSHPSKLSAIKA